MSQERRKFKRYPVIHEMDRPIQLTLEKDVLPAVLVDLSAGGMALLTYASIPIGKEINIIIDFPGFKSHTLNGQVVWSLPKGEMFRVGIAFNKLDPVDFRHINRMAFDFTDCQTKLTLGVTDVCFKKCSYYSLCQKEVKKKF